MVAPPEQNGRTPAGVEITGVAQREAWQRRVMPPVEEVRPGLWTMPVPIPESPLRYTLAYAFVEDAGAVVVDPGWNTAEGRAALTAGLAAAGASTADVAGVVVTHIHPDHHGLSGWLREQSGGWIAMHPLEAETLPARAWAGRDRPPTADPVWLRRHGVPEDEIGALSAQPAQIAEILRMAEPDRLLHDGDPVPGLTRGVRAVWTPGHTPGHLCLHDPAAGVLLTGDHLLPRISPNIAARGLGEEIDPLSAYLESLDRMAGFGADEALPAHEYRFRGIDARAAALVRHHHERGAEILAAVDRLGDAAAWAIAAELTWSRGWAALHGMMRRMALAETVAHLLYLTTEKQLIPTPTLPEKWRRP
jgi:glyoxylase-like metal-dependent hydrolase (beta-lactamase superfamily II)